MTPAEALTRLRFSPPVLGPVLAVRHRRSAGRLPRLLAPRTFNEKVLHRMLFDRRPVLTTWSGKLESRDYVLARTGNAGLLPVLVGTARDGRDLLDLRLPARYVVKANHLSGRLRIVDEDSPVDLHRLGEQVQAWCRERSRLQWGYQGVARVAVVEEHLTASGPPPPDYKLFCFAGQVRLVMLDQGRYGGHTRDFFDPAWERLPLSIAYPPSVTPPPRPRALDDMVQVAQLLSVGHDFVRVDLYDVAGQVRFGELTAYPGGGDDPIEPPEWDRWLADWWTRPYRGSR